MSNVQNWFNGLSKNGSSHGTNKDTTLGDMGDRRTTCVSPRADPTIAGVLMWLDSGPPRRMDARVQWIVRRLREQPFDTQSASLKRLALMVRLSPSRFMHVFTESVGVPLRSYLLRLKLRRAVEGLALGHNVTVAAHLAGFADAPHLTRTCRRILGITPRELVRRPAPLSALRLPFPFAGSSNLGVPTTDLQVKHESRAHTAADSFKTRRMVRSRIRAGSSMSTASCD